MIIMTYPSAFAIYSLDPFWVQIAYIYYAALNVYLYTKAQISW